MKKEILIALIIALALAVPPSAAWGIKYWLDNTYVQISSLAEQTNQQRIWQLQDKIDGTKRRARREGRSLNNYELDDIERWSTQIRRLGGVPQ